MVDGLHDQLVRADVQAYLQNLPERTAGTGHEPNLYSVDTSVNVKAQVHGRGSYS